MKATTEKERESKIERDKEAQFSQRWLFSIDYLVTLQQAACSNYVFQFQIPFLESVTHRGMPPDYHVMIRRSYDQKKL